MVNIKKTRFLAIDTVSKELLDTVSLENTRFFFMITIDKTRFLIWAI